MYGCPRVPRIEKLDDLEIPPAYWGQQEKSCPACRRTILAAALRCRHCGTIFASAAPQNQAQFRARSELAGRLPTAKRISIWMLVLGLIPFTAPIAAVLGAVWYAERREEIEALPAVNRAMCKIAVAVAATQTAVIILATLLYALLRA